MRCKSTKSKLSMQFGVGLICLLTATFGVSAQTVIYVDDNAPGGAGTSWVDAHNSLQDALVTTSPGDSLRVAQGSYLAPSGGFVLTNGIEILGGFAGLGAVDPDLRDPAAFITILTGDTNGDDIPGGNRSDNRFHVITGFSLSAETILDGLTVTAGNANGVFSVQKNGGGLSIGLSTLTVRDCIFSDNDAEPGVGVGGGVFATNGDYQFINCQFDDNFAPHGGGLAFVAGTSGSLLIEGCVFFNNTSIIGGGGVEISSTIPDVVIQNCVFENNSATLDASIGGVGGGLRGLSNGMVVVNCLFVGNFAARCGGAIQTTLDSFSSLPAPLVVNSTITENITGSSGLGGGICLLPSDGEIIVVNTILWNNTDSTGRNESAQIDFSFVTDPIVSSPDISFSIIDGLVTPGDFDTGNNSGMDPIFFDVLIGDYSLASLSPAIDAGSNADVPIGVLTDLAGNDRILGSAVDMGAFESSGFLDSDGDGIPDVDDNCPSVVNPDQADFDGDGFGDVCDADDDNDGLTDAAEISLAAGGACPDPLNPDSDDDGRADGVDPFPCNTKPIADAALLQLTNIGSDAQVRLDGTASSDSDDDALTFKWFIDGMSICIGDRTSCSLIEVGLAYGDHDVTLRVSDADESDEVTKTISITASALSTFEIDQVDVKFETGPTSSMKIRGEIGLPLGVSVSELDPITFLRVAAGGVEVLPYTPTIFTVKGDGQESVWEFKQDPGGPGLVKFDIDWKGARFRYKEKNFPIELKSQLITTSQTDLTVKFKRKKLGGPVMIDIGGLATINIDGDGNLTADVTVEEVEVRKEYTVILPFPLTNSTVITVTGSQNRTILAGDYLRASVGRFGIDLLFDSAAFPDGANTLPRTLDIMLNVGAQMYSGDTFLDETNITVKKNKWKSKGR